MDSLLTVYKNTSVSDTNRYKIARNIADTYFAKEKYWDALDYYNEALKISEKRGVKKETYACYVSIGSVYIHKSELSRALESYISALNTIQEVGDKKETGICLINIAGVYIDQYKYPEALESLKKALQLMKEVGDKQGIAASYQDMEVYYKNKSKFKLARQYRDSASSLMNGSELANNGIIHFQNVSDAYAKSGNKEKDSKSEDDIVLKSTGKSFDNSIIIAEVTADSISYEVFGKIHTIPISDVSSYAISKASERDSLYKYYSFRPATPISHDTSSVNKQNNRPPNLSQENSYIKEKKTPKEYLLTFSYAYGVNATGYSLSFYKWAKKADDEWIFPAVVSFEYIQLNSVSSGQTESIYYVKPGVNVFKRIGDYFMFNFRVQVPIGSELITYEYGNSTSNLIIGMYGNTGIYFVPKSDNALVVGLSVFGQLLSSQTYPSDYGFKIEVGIKF